MVVVVLTAGGALLALRAYNKTKEQNPDRLDQSLRGIRQQAGVMAAICGSIFTVIAALEKAKIIGNTPAASNNNSSSSDRPWGRARRIVDLVDEVV